MKRMSYLAGLAPAALALAAAPAAHAAITPGIHAANGKTVSLHHILPTTARANAAAASSSGTVSPATTAGCMGNTYFSIPKTDNLQAHGWYANNWDDSNTCIGTVIAKVRFNKTLCKDVGLNIGTATSTTWRSHHSLCGTAGTSVTTQFNVHTNFPHTPITEGIFVCINSTYHPADICTEVGS